MTASSEGSCFARMARLRSEGSLRGGVVGVAILVRGETLKKLKSM